MKKKKDTGGFDRIRSICKRNQTMGIQNCEKRDSEKRFRGDSENQVGLAWCLSGVCLVLASGD